MKTIPLSIPNVCGREQSYIDKALADGWVSPAGPYVTEFEKQFAAYVGAEEACACMSGTAGLHLALLESGVQQGEAVLVPDLTFIATLNPVRYCGAVPILLDCGDDLCIDVEKLRDFCEKECRMRNGALYESRGGRRVRAIIPVHIFGGLCDMEAICEIAREFNLFVIEDACEALGSRWNAGNLDGVHAGLAGDIGVFSFNGNKIMTTGGGGMIVAKDPEKLAHMRYLSQQAKDDVLRFVHNEAGFNYRMGNLQAGLGLGQLEQMPAFLKAKKENFEYYVSRGLPMLPFNTALCSPNYWFYSLLSDGHVEEMMAGLKAQGIESRPIWRLMHTLKPYERCRAYRIEKAEHYAASVVNIPCSTNLTPEERERVADSCLSLLGEIR